MFGRLKWALQGRPKVKYQGYHCGCCGKWIKEEFSLPIYQSYGEWWDTWRLCLECAEGGKKNEVY